MKVIIDAYDLWKLELPAGRVIGDCTCHYHSFDVWVVCLKTNQGHSGWGFGETISKGIFTKPAPWITPMPTLADIRQRFERNAWPVIHGNHPFQLKMHLPRLFSDPVAGGSAGTFQEFCRPWFSSRQGESWTSRRPS